MRLVSHDMESNQLFPWPLIFQCNMCVTPQVYEPLAAPLQVAISQILESVFFGFWAIRDTEFYPIPPWVPAADDTVEKATDKAGDATDYMNMMSQQHL